MSRKRSGGAKFRSMYACLNGSISHEKTCSTRRDWPACCCSALQIMSSASSGDSVPEHMVATRSGRPQSSDASAARDRPSSAAPRMIACASVRCTMSSNMDCGLTKTGSASTSSELHFFLCFCSHAEPDRPWAVGLALGLRGASVSNESSSSLIASPSAGRRATGARPAAGFLAAARPPLRAGGEGGSSRSVSDNEPSSLSEPSSEPDADPSDAAGADWPRAAAGEALRGWRCGCLGSSLSDSEHESSMSSSLASAAT
mmetsp:Transcript_31584/g.102009  ORF Transcript_31584/g.102009 Transcript_31584/m.102009 type:complete len:258 (+) Transcript_31584:391-1164(+)